MQKKVYKLCLLATLFFVGLYSFNTTVVAAEEEDFNEQEVTFTLIQGKDLPSDSNDGQQGSSITKPVGTGKLPSTGEMIQYLFPIAGVICLIVLIGYMIARKRKEEDSYETK